MTTKPVMQSPTAIDVAVKENGYVSFWAAPDAAKEFEQFGKLSKWEGDTEKYTLYVDGRFNFNAVVAYIKNYG